MTRALVMACAVPVLVAATRLDQTASAQDATVQNRIYDQAQAKKGLAVYDKDCATCHDGGTMGPELWGEGFRSQWEGKTVGTLFTRIRDTMPQDNPQTLSEEQVLGVIAFVLQQNGFPAGDQAIPNAAALATVKIVSPQ